MARAKQHTTTKDTVFAAIGKKRPATQAERDAITFEGIPIKLKWTNKEWSSAHLTHLRLASLMLQDDHVAMQKRMGALVETGLAPTLLESLCRTKEQFLHSAKVLNVAITRSFLTLERLGYGPDNPPPTKARGKARVRRAEIGRAA
jgi:hypothetical protein